MKRYKAIFLDWDDTIGDFHNAEQCALRDIYNKYQLHTLYSSFEDYYAVYHPHNIELWDKYGRSEVTKDELQLDRFLFPLVSAPVNQDHDAAISLPGTQRHDSLIDVAAAIGKDFLTLTSKYFRLLPHAGEVVRTLANEYPLVIVSNGFIEVQYEKIHLSGLTDCFRYVVLSEEVGAQKPNPVIYEHALRLGEWDKQEVLMIGDSYNSDILGARNAGIDQLWITADIDDPRPSTFRVSDIREVLTLLSARQDD